MIILECLVILISIAFVLLGAIGQFFVQKKIFFSISSFVWALGILSGADILRLIKNKHSIILSIIVRIRSKKKLYSISPTKEQQKVLDKFFSSASKAIYFKSVIINGPKGTGKSECVDFILKNIFSKIKYDSNLIDFHFHYIDCYNDSDNATNFINQLTAESAKNSIIFIDNCNEAKGEIIPNIKYLSDNKNSCIILIEEEGCFYYNNEIFNDNNKESFTQKTAPENSLFYTSHHIIKTVQQRRIIFAIYLYSKFKNLFKLSDITELLNLTKIEKLQCKLFIYQLKNKQILQSFPVFSNFYKLSSEAEIDYIKKLISYNVDLFSKIIYKFVHTCNNDEIKWMCLFELPPNLIQKNTKELYSLFNKAIAYGNFCKLLKILKAYCKKYKCADKFAYELSILYYYNGDFTNAYNYYHKIKNIDAVEKDILLIETLHGKNDPKIKKLVDETISSLKSKNELIGEYWEYHVLSEKGEFKTSNLNNLLTKLIKIYNNHPSILQKTIIERCFTDLLRFNWIEGNSFDIECIKQNFTNIFKDNNQYDYYFTIYFIAGHIHYSTIPNCWLKDMVNDIDNKVKKAICNYNLALSLPYEKIKSKTATKTKLADVSLMQFEYSWEEIEKYVLEFKKNAEQQNIDVFIAYSKTLLAKIRILRVAINEILTPSEIDINNIKNLLNSAKDIYKNYNNSYGVIRCDYLLILFNCLLNFNFSNSNFILYWGKLVELKESCNTLEAHFIDKLKRYSSFKYINFYNSIKYFPIILQ